MPRRGLHVPATRWYTELHRALGLIAWVLSDMACSRTCTLGGGQLDRSESHPLCLLGASWVAHICFKEELVLSVGEQVAVAGTASLGTCSNEFPGAPSHLAAMPRMGMLFCFELVPSPPDAAERLIRAQAYSRLDDTDQTVPCAQMSSYIPPSTLVPVALS